VRQLTDAFRLVRQIVVFLMGVVTMLVGLFTSNDTVTLLIIGMIMAGVLPLDNFLGLFGRRRVHDVELDDPPRPKRPVSGEIP